MSEESITPPAPARPHRFRHFFLRGLAVLLPTILTIWILIAAYGFVEQRIAEPINRGVRELLVRYSPFPAATADDYDQALDDLSDAQRQAWSIAEEQMREQLGPAPTQAERIQRQRKWMRGQPKIRRVARRHALDRWWHSATVGNWAVFDLVGIIIAIVLIYMVGLAVGSFIGSRLISRGEKMLQKVPLVRQIYPSVKQVTDFLVGGNQTIKFNRVVAVEYPRKGLWSVGLVTGETMRRIQEEAGESCLTVFVPSSPTPFTGYVITVPQKDTIDLGVSIEDALRFSVSGGVIIPPSQLLDSATPSQIDRDESEDDDPENSPV
ncbi:MAG: DUF502 domain-containing protein [Phycisphaeraceae bacterium]|nr:DUF502 domain-containing protein [Phycisphaeraceae bacterium]